MLILERYLVEARRVALTFALELRKAGFRPASLRALEESVECALEIDERLLADVRRDLVQPRAVALLEFDEMGFQLPELRPLARQLVDSLRLGEAPVVDVPGSADTLRQQHAMLSVRGKLKPERLLHDLRTRTHVRSLAQAPDSPNENPHPLP